MSLFKGTFLQEHFLAWSTSFTILYLTLTENANVLESHLEGLGGAWGARLEGIEKMCAAPNAFV